TVIAGCRYHVARPDGGGYERRPAEAREAEARRARRFEAYGPEEQRVAPAVNRENAETSTLDLRWRTQ
ncbi:MAG: transglutaminase family protein, partial [Betaproteobacteria bacterium]